MRNSRGKSREKVLGIRLFYREGEESALDNNGIKIKKIIPLYMPRSQHQCPKKLDRGRKSNNSPSKPFGLTN